MYEKTSADTAYATKVYGGSVSRLRLFLTSELDRGEY